MIQPDSNKHLLEKLSDSTTNPKAVEKKGSLGNLTIKPVSSSKKFTHESEVETPTSGNHTAFPPTTSLDPEIQRGIGESHTIKVASEEKEATKGSPIENSPKEYLQKIALDLSHYKVQIEKLSLATHLSLARIAETLGQSRHFHQRVEKFYNEVSKIHESIIEILKTLDSYQDKGVLKRDKQALSLETKLQELLKKFEAADKNPDFKEISRIVYDEEMLQKHQLRKISTYTTNRLEEWIRRFKDDDEESEPTPDWINYKQNPGYDGHVDNEQLLSGGPLPEERETSLRKGADQLAALLKSKFLI